MLAKGYRFDRRKFLIGTGALLTTALGAGCIGNDEPPDDNDDVPDNDVEEWLADVENFDQIHDFTGEAQVNVDVGQVEGYDQPFVFEPAAIRIDTGTTVVWEWVDEDTHSVTDEGGAFDSGLIDGLGETWEYTFDDAGTFLYYCTPHRALEQKGAVVVE